MDKNIKKLEIILKQELTNLINKKCNKKVIQRNIDILNNVNILLSKKIEILIKNKMTIFLCLDTVFGKDNLYSKELINDIVWLENCNLEIVDMEEYQNKIDNILSLKQNIEEDIFEMELQLEEIANIEKSKNGFNKIQRISYLLQLLKYEQRISENYLEFIYDFLNSKNISQKEIIYILESLRERNISIQKTIINNPNLKFDYSILNTINIGFEYYKKLPVSEVEESKLLLRVQSIITSFEECLKLNGTIQFDLELLKFNEKIDNIYSYKAFYHLLMNAIQDKMIEMINLIQDKDFYFDKQIKIQVLKNYNDYLRMYLESRNYIDKQIFDYENPNIETELIENKNKNHLFFAKKNDCTYFEKDLKNIPKEYFYKIEQLLNNFKENTIPRKQIKFFNSAGMKKFVDFFELKDDQVRICAKRIKDNYYLITGVGIKKENINTKLLEAICRPSDIKEDEIDSYLKEEQQIYDNIIEYCKNNKRRGNR